jgi:hypothetical protein
MTVGVKDRSSYDEIKQGGMDYILTELQESRPKDVQITTTATTPSATASSKYPPLPIDEPVSVSAAPDDDKVDKELTNPGNFFSNIRLFMNRPPTETKVSR